MTQEEMIKRIEALEAANAAILHVLWNIRANDLGVAKKIEQELAAEWHKLMKNQHEKTATYLKV